MANPTRSTPREAHVSAGAVLDVFCRNIGIFSRSIATVVGKTRPTIDNWRNQSIRSIQLEDAHRIARYLNEVCPAGLGEGQFHADQFTWTGLEAIEWLKENRPTLFLKHELAVLVA